MPLRTEPGAAAPARHSHRDPADRSFATRWGRALEDSRWIDAEAADRTDRQVSQLISLGGVALILGQSASMAASAGEFATWWNCVALTLVVQIVGFAVFGGVLPARLLRAGWIAAPILGAVLLFLSYAAYAGPLPAGVSPWPWAFEAALVSYLVLTLRPRWATAGTVASALLPLLSAAVFLGEAPHVVLVETPIHLANVIYMALFTGIRARLNRLRDAEAQALAAEAQRVRAQVSARDKEHLARLIHDEVLSVLVAAAPFRGDPPAELRSDAGRAAALFEQPAREPEAGLLAADLAADQVLSALRRVDPRIDVECTQGSGEVPSGVVETVAAAAAEALRNCVRHASGAHREVAVSVGPERVAVLVQDRGPGFDLDRVDARHLGIHNSIIGRMRALPGGDAAVESGPGGTRVLVSWRT